MTKEQLKEYLLELLEPGDTVYTVMRHVSQSGMTRWIDLYVIRDSVPIWISGAAAKVLQRTGIRSKYNAVKIEGCGMDMGFALVYELSSALYRTAEQRGYVTGRNGSKDPETDGGYLLNHKWI